MVPFQGMFRLHFVPLNTTQFNVQKQNLFQISGYTTRARYHCNKKNDSRMTVVYFCKLPLVQATTIYIVKLKHIATGCCTHKRAEYPRSIVCGYACSREVELRNTTSLSTNIAVLRPSLISAISDSTAMRPISA